MRIHAKAVAIVAGLLLLGYLAAAHAECGADLGLPRNHFEGVNERGFVSHWEEIAKVDCGAGLELPLNINFRSDRELVSPYIGYGWSVALLESRFLQVDDRKFIMTQINGTQSSYYRRGPADKVLKGDGGWIAQIGEDTVIATAPCGWKITFVRGRISSILTPKNRKLEFVYAGTIVRDIVENGVSKVHLEMSEDGGCAKAIVLNGRRIEVDMAGRPRVQTIRGQRIIAEVAPSLHQVTVPGATRREFSFSTDPQLTPTLATSGEKPHFYTWDPSTKRVLSDNKWSYNVKPSAAGLYAEISRTNDSGGSEFWYNDLARARETVKNAADDFSLVYSRFGGSGPLAGQLRKVERVRGSSVETIQSTVYDEKGCLLKELLEGGLVKQYGYNKDGYLDTIVEEVDGKLKQRLTFNAARIVKQREEADGTRISYELDKMGRERAIYRNGKLHLLREWASEDNSVEEKIFGPDGVTIERTFYKKFDQVGRVITKRITELSFKAEPVTIQYKYDELGRLAREISSRDGDFLYSYSGGISAVKRVIDAVNTK
jgi:hypothetical protein